MQILEPLYYVENGDGITKIIGLVAFFQAKKFKQHFAF